MEPSAIRIGKHGVGTFNTAGDFVDFLGRCNLDIVFEGGRGRLVKKYNLLGGKDQSDSEDEEKKIWFEGDAFGDGSDEDFKYNSPKPPELTAKFLESDDEN